MWHLRMLICWTNEMVVYRKGPIKAKVNNLDNNNVGNTETFHCSQGYQSSREIKINNSSQISCCFSFSWYEAQMLQWNFPFAFIQRITTRSQPKRELSTTRVRMGRCLFVSLGIKDLRTRCFCPPIFLPGRGILRPDSKFCVFFQFRKFCVCIDGTLVLYIYLFGYFISSRLDSFRVAASDVGLITNLVLEMYNSGQASRKWFLDTVSCVEREREITTTTFEKLQNSAIFEICNNSWRPCLGR